tara:strand:+ start:241 stop:768 length:528 start_codon:yes stop_codon:yes gene_type:complete
VRKDNSKRWRFIVDLGSCDTTIDWRVYFSDLERVGKYFQAESKTEYLPEGFFEFEWGAELDEVQDPLDHYLELPDSGILELSTGLGFALSNLSVSQWTEYQGLILKFVREAPFAYGYWKHWKKVFKRIHLSSDVSITAALLARIDVGTRLHDADGNLENDDGIGFGPTVNTIYCD